jgi:excinuclease ABC subunit B
MYADSVTDSMERAIRETLRRREIQQAYNEQNGITPQTIVKDVRDIIEIGASGDRKADEKSYKSMSRAEREQLITGLTREMKLDAKMLEFEHAAYLRDRIQKLREGK